MWRHLLNYYKRESALVEGPLTNLKPSVIQFSALSHRERRGPRLQDEPQFTEASHGPLAASAITSASASAAAAAVNQSHLQVDVRESAMQGTGLACVLLHPTTGGSQAPRKCPVFPHTRTTAP